jgi:xanthine dehydrogenase accessory factor
MKEINDILQAFERAKEEGQSAALATVVHVEGSSYRRPGARMLVTEKGQLTGAISGGCLEGDALRKALLAIHQRQNKLVVYDTTKEDDFQFGVQLGCNGVVHILFEPIDPDRPQNPIDLLRELIRERRDAVLLTLFTMDHSRRQPGTCLVYAGGEVRTNLTGELLDAVIPDVEAAFGDRSSCLQEYATDGQPLFGFVEFIPPSPALVIAGAGNDVLPLVEITSLLGWHTTVVDGRAQHATAQRFSKADRVLVAKPQQVLRQLRPDDQTLFLLMTHNYQYDRALLKELLQRNFPYIGILGPRSKLERMLGEIREEGIIFPAERLNSLHGPVGLDIGAETAQEIAVSIAAEIKAFLSGRRGTPLREKTECIHHR